MVIGEIRTAEELGRKWTHRYVWHACVDCGKERWVYFLNNEPKNVRCKRCSVSTPERKLALLIGNKKNRGVNHPNWNGGRGYYPKVKLLSDDLYYSMADKKGYVYVHRLVMAKKLGRSLRSWEIVNHKDRKVDDCGRKNNDPNNLELVSVTNHNQITILENRVLQLESENQSLREQIENG